MFKNYFKTAWRNLIKNKTFSFINIFGLTVGLTSFLLIALFVFDEMTFDGFHKNADNIYRVVRERTSLEGEKSKHAGAGYLVSKQALAEFPEIKNAARYATFGRINVGTTVNNNIFYENYSIASPKFLTFFDFKLLQGNRNTALTAPYTAVITEETAMKLFHTTNVIGKVLKTDLDNPLCKITGVLKDFPSNSHISFNILFSEYSMSDEDLKDVNTDWNSGNFATYFLLDPKADPKKVELKINSLVTANQKQAATGKTDFILQPLKDIHFYSNDIEGTSVKKGNIMYVYVFAAVSLFILLIACFNYINLNTAAFSKRAKEIAVRKVAGASKKDLVKQFMSETFLIAIISFLMALLLVEIVLPYFNSFTGKHLTLGMETDYRIWIGVGAIILVVGFLSGFYPALLQSSLKPLQLFKSIVITGKAIFSLRKSLVVVQFALSIIMIVATMIVYQQIKYVSNKDMGFKKDQLVVIDINSGKVRRGAQTIKTEFLKLPDVQNVSLSSRVPGEWKNIPKVKVANNNENDEMYFLGVDKDFLSTYQVALADGRNFTGNDLADSSEILINETAAKQLGITHASEQLIDIQSRRPFKTKVIGIVKDFNFQSLREPLSPMIIGYKNNPVMPIDYFTAKVNPVHLDKTFAAMQAVLYSIDQDHLFEYHFLDKQWELFYKQDKVRETIFLIISILAILIACLGLFGLATYEANQRIKEIGIRKVLGARVSGIVAMLSKDFLKLVLIAMLIAFPIGWWAMKQWLYDFAYRINISWWVFAIAGFVALLIALIALSFQAIKAAIANPVKSLRSE